MITIRGDEIIIGPCGGNGPGNHGFLADVEMAESANLLRLILLARTLLKRRINSISESISTSSRCSGGCMPV